MYIYSRLMQILNGLRDFKTSALKQLYSPQVYRVMTKIHT